MAFGSALLDPRPTDGTLDAGAHEFLGTLLRITTNSPLTAGNLGSAYSVTLAATGGTTPYTDWSVTSGSLPAGLNLNSSTGTITGTPTVSGTFNFTVQVTDSNSDTATKDFTLVINPMTITTASPLASGGVGVAYGPVTLTKQNGVGPTFTWAVTSGSLPAGLSLDGSTGVISGTPTASGSSNFTVTLTDSSSNTATKDFTLTVEPMSISTSSLANARETYSYSPVTLAVQHGTGPYTWAITSGTLPSGLNFDTSTGVLSGTPIVGTQGTYNLTFRVTDSNALTATRDLTLLVNPEIMPCTDADWSSSDGACQSNNTLTRTWTQTNTTCTGGVTHPATEIISCSYSTVCTETDWSSSDGACQSNNLLPRTWTKINATCTGGITHPASENINCAYSNNNDDDDPELKIKNVKIIKVTTNSVTFTYKTTNNANEKILFGLAAATKNLNWVMINNKKSKLHTITLNKLRPGTTYYFKIKGKDKYGQTESSKIYSFTTKRLYIAPTSSGGATNPDGLTVAPATGPHVEQKTGN